MTFVGRSAEGTQRQSNPRRAEYPLVMIRRGICEEVCYVPVRSLLTKCDPKATSTKKPMIPATITRL